MRLLRTRRCREPEYAYTKPSECNTPILTRKQWNAQISLKPAEPSNQSSNSVSPYSLLHTFSAHEIHTDWHPPQISPPNAAEAAPKCQARVPATWAGRRVGRTCLVLGGRVRWRSLRVRRNRLAMLMGVEWDDDFLCERYTLVDWMIVEMLVGILYGS